MTSFSIVASPYSRDSSNSWSIVTLPAITPTNDRTTQTASGSTRCLGSLRITITGVHMAASTGPLSPHACKQRPWELQLGGAMGHKDPSCYCWVSFTQQQQRGLSLVNNLYGNYS